MKTWSSLLHALLVNETACYVSHQVPCLAAAVPKMSGVCTPQSPPLTRYAKKQKQFLW